MQVCFTRNGAGNMDGALVRFESKDDYDAFSLKSAAWDIDAGGITFESNGTNAIGVVETPEVGVTSGFDHLVLSWNATTPMGSSVRFFAQALVDGYWTNWYRLGIWNRGGCPQHRTSFKDQSDDYGTVDCDILKLNSMASAFKVKIELVSCDVKSYPTLRFLSVNVIDSAAWLVDAPPYKEAWGMELAVPELCQISVEGGDGWCSPTSTAMLLNYWADELNRPDLKSGVTQTAQAVHDEAWGGTGNWTFNTAHAGEYPGIRAYVTRFSSISQIERWIEKGVPVIVSLHYSRLRKIVTEHEAGHLMVMRGFTPYGDPIFNDPWARTENGEKLRKIFPRQDLEDAWLGPKGSWGTVYIIHPEGFDWR